MHLSYSLTTLLKRTLTIASRRLMILGTLFLSLTFFATCTPMDRERRFIVGDLVSGVSGIFSRQFDVKNVTQTLSDADRLRSYGLAFKDYGVWFDSAAASYRKSLFHGDAQAHRAIWKNAAKMLTKLADILLVEEPAFTRASIWIRLILTGTLEHENEEHVFRVALKSYGDGAQRLEGLLPEVAQALTKLRDVTGLEAEKDVTMTLKRIKKTDEIVKKVRRTYESLVKAVGLKI